MRNLTLRRRWVPAMLPLFLWAATFAFEAPMAASARGSAWMAARQADGSRALAQLAGSFRTVAANVLWVKAEAYHHEWEERGLSWSSNTELLPLLRAITYLDPGFVEAYGVHSFLLARQGKPDQALALLREGIGNNPGRYELYEAAAMLYARDLKRPEASLPFFERASALARDPFDRRRLSRTLHLLKEHLHSLKSTSRGRHRPMGDGAGPLAPG